MKKALGKVIVAFLICLLSFAVVSPRPAMADQYYCMLGQEPDCLRQLPLSGDVLFVDIPPSGVNFIDVNFSNFSDNQAVVNSDIDSPIVMPPFGGADRNYPVVPASSVTFSNASPVRDTTVQIRVFGYSR
ncbi:MAG: hypothetical protein F6K23_21665 [Okeania sp. SIO2C9]|uniref:hypothetical protein n=1 Tax=Okeania sp. SIO2C9 TaxID=2607791 RepID=UPI0013BF3EC9|nr:hypothetical protein [Okeania sp. SIO2C9]NEQ75426.1 hypothetical protein [Okeania sp. SIO2C9]